MSPYRRPCLRTSSTVTPSAWAPVSLPSSSPSAPRTAVHWSAELVHRKDVRKAEGLTAGDLMTHPPVTAAPDDPVEQAARMMHFMRVKRLPVVNSGGQLVGIISRADVLAVFDRPDEDVRKDVVNGILLHEYLVDPRQFRVTVESGVVTMEGTPETAAFGRALIRKVRHVPGVVAVRDRLSYPDVYPVVAGPVF
jgi:CBS-domain-containing membrane protein